MSETQGIREIMQSSKKNLRQHFMTWAGLFEAGLR